LITPQPGELAGWIRAFGGEITDPNQPGYLFDTPETRQAFNYVKSLLDSGCAWSDPAADPKYSFARRGALFVVSSTLDIPSQRMAFDQANNQDEWIVIPFPALKQPVIDSYGPSVILTHSTPAQQLAAWLVTKWLVFPHNQVAWVKSIGALPTRQSSTNYLLENSGPDDQWNQALELLPDAWGEPTLASWSVVRWALGDAAAELIDPKLSSNDIPELLNKLDSTAAEIFSQVH
jgi:ABC-type glycerol-3-phosphate transport system substrate-binding protein